MKMINLTVPGHEDATLEGYILDCEITLGQDTNRPAVIVCPGGGYLYCSPREAEPVALAYAARGIHAFILRYSTGWAAQGFVPLEEIDWAIGYVRENADKWHIDPNKILTCGFSAGGHLALASGVMAKNRPDGMILCYPAVTIPSTPRIDFMLKFLIGKEDVTEEDAASVDLLSKIDKNSPPVFLVATAEDLLTGYGALPVAQKYNELQMGYELHIFQHGPHGYALATHTSADGSSRMLNADYAQWHDMSISWINKTFGQPEFVDKSTGKMAQKLAEMGITFDQQP